MALYRSFRKCNKFDFCCDLCSMLLDFEALCDGRRPEDKNVAFCARPLAETEIGTRRIAKCAETCAWRRTCPALGAGLVCGVLRAPWPLGMHDACGLGGACCGAGAYLLRKTSAEAPFQDQTNPLSAQSLLGRRQVVRHRFLVPAFAGSNPAAPARLSLT